MNSSQYITGMTGVNDIKSNYATPKEVTIQAKPRSALSNYNSNPSSNQNMSNQNLSNHNTN